MVNSKRGTQFRIWTTSVLRNHIMKGYAVNERRLKELNQAFRLIANVAECQELSGDEAKALLSTENRMFSTPIISVIIRSASTLITGVLQRVAKDAVIFPA